VLKGILAFRLTRRAIVLLSLLVFIATGPHFSISAAVGFISLLGVSVMNGILIMTYFNETRAAGVGTLDAMFRAASQRMRSMLMTAFVGVYRPFACGGFYRHRPSSTATARNGRCGWNARWSDDPLDCCAGDPGHVPRP
jgi:hypothetical protein